VINGDENADLNRLIYIIGKCSYDIKQMRSYARGTKVALPRIFARVSARSALLFLLNYYMKSKVRNKMSTEEQLRETSDGTEVSATSGPESAETMNDFARELEASLRKINEGDIISGTVIAVNEDGAVLDLRYYTQGILKAEDMSKDPGFSILRDVKVGDVLEAAVVMTDDGRGNIRLSRIEANQVLAWDKLERYRQEEKTFTVKISGVTNGGAICYLEDTRGFIPASQLSLEYVEDVNQWLNKTLDVRVITVDRDKEKLVLSAKVIAQEAAKAARDHAVAMIVPGSVLEGTVESLMPYGAFINLGSGMSGLVHISQISQKRIKKPDEVLKVGEKVKVKVINTDNGKISLSIKGLEEEQETDSLEAFPYESEGALTTSMGSLFAKLKLDK
jgi:small subunit ribosomal protein S1